MLTIYRRHTKSCPHREQGRSYRRCKCPVWVDGTLGQEEIRQSLKTRDWQKAQQIARDWETSGSQPDEPRRVTVQDAATEFLEDATARHLSEATISKHRVLFRSLLKFCTAQSIVYLDELDVPLLRRFRASWPDNSLSAQKKFERLRSFFRFACDSGWIAASPAVKLRPPKVQVPPTMPFDRDQMQRILGALDRYPDNYGVPGQQNAQRLRSFVLTLRYTGLRIRDVVTLPVRQLAGSRLFLYTQKTGVPVYCPLPDFVADSLRACPRTNPDYFFWTGNSQPKSAVGDWQRALRKLFLLAEIPDGHAHRFRDTFAVELLLAGVPLERVSVLLGHRSVQVTERHYAPWVHARQEQMEADVRRSWGRDPVVFRFTKGTPEVHGPSDPVN